MRVSLLLLLPWLASGMGCAVVNGRSSVCGWVVSVTYIRPLPAAVNNTDMNVYHIVGPVHSGLNWKLNTIMKTQNTPLDLGFGS